MLVGKGFSDNENVIVEIVDYFETKDKSYHKNDLDKLTDCHA